MFTTLDYATLDRRIIPGNQDMSRALKVENGLPLDRVVALFVIVQLILTGSVVALGRDYHGFRRGACLSPRARTTARLTSAALLFVVSCNSVLIVWRLVVDPEALGNKDELSLTAAALGALWWTDLLLLRPRVRRRRRVAELLALMPTFRLGRAGKNSPLGEACSVNEFVIRSARFSIQADCCTTRGERSGNRSRDDEKHLYWRGTVARVYQHHQAFNGYPGGIVVLHDEATQDEAGSELLTPEFTHEENSNMDKTAVANVAWRALKRAQVHNLGKWRPGFMQQVAQTLATVRGVGGILNGELGRSIDWDETDDPVVKQLWAAIVDELLKYLERGEKMYVLPAFAKVPTMVNEQTPWDGSELLAAISKFAKAD